MPVERCPCHHSLSVTHSRPPILLCITTTTCVTACCTPTLVTGDSKPHRRRDYLRAWAWAKRHLLRGCLRGCRAGGAKSRRSVGWWRRSCGEDCSSGLVSQSSSSGSSGGGGPAAAVPVLALGGHAAISGCLYRAAAHCAGYRRRSEILIQCLACRDGQYRVQQVYIRRFSASMSPNDNRPSFT